MTGLLRAGLLSTGLLLIHPLLTGALQADPLLADRSAAADSLPEAPPAELLARIEAASGRAKADLIRDLANQMAAAAESRNAPADGLEIRVDAPDEDLLERVATTFTEALDDRATAVRRAAIRGLGRLPLEQARAEDVATRLAPLLSEAKGRTAELLVEALGHLGAPAGVPALLDHLGGPSDQEVHRALARIGKAGAAPLHAALDDPRPTVRLTAARRIVRFDGDSQPASRTVRAFLTDPNQDPALRNLALCTPTAFEASPAEAEWLFRLAPTVPAETRSCILRRLVHVGAPVVELALPALEDPEHPMHAAAPSLLLKIQPLAEETRRRIEARRDDPHPTVRREALTLYVTGSVTGSVTGDHPDAEVLPALLAALEDPDSGVRGLAVGHLIQRDADGEAVETALRRLFEDDPDPGVRNLAGSRLRALGVLPPLRRPAAVERGWLDSWYAPAAAGALALVALVALILAWLRRRRAAEEMG